MCNFLFSRPPTPTIEYITCNFLYSSCPLIEYNMCKFLYFSHPYLAFKMEKSWATILATRKLRARHSLFMKRTRFSPARRPATPVLNTRSANWRSSHSTRSMSKLTTSRALVRPRQTSTCLLWKMVSRLLSFYPLSCPLFNATSPGFLLPSTVVLRITFDWSTCIHKNNLFFSSI